MGAMSRRGPRGPSAYDVEAYGSDEDGYSYSSDRGHKGEDGDGGGGAGGGGCCGLGRQLRWVLAGWLLALGLLAIWYSEHVALNTQLLSLTDELRNLQSEYVNVARNTKALSDQLGTIEAAQRERPLGGAVGAAAGAPPAAAAKPEAGHVAAAKRTEPPPPPPLPPRPAAPERLHPGPPTPDPAPAPPGQCRGWRQTGGCTSTGPREPDHDKGCQDLIWTIWSGYCECDWGDHRGVGNSCTHQHFTCEEACNGGSEWQPPAPPPPPPIGNFRILPGFSIESAITI